MPGLRASDAVRSQAMISLPPLERGLRPCIENWCVVKALDALAAHELLEREHVAAPAAPLEHTVAVGSLTAPHSTTPLHVPPLRLRIGPTLRPSILCADAV